MQLTVRQIQQLDALAAAGATSLKTAVGPYDGHPFNNMVLGRLQSMGLAESKVVRAGSLRGNGLRSSGQQTVYWLTPAGLTKAQQR